MRTIDSTGGSLSQCTTLVLPLVSYHTRLSS
jgi:hypothetical protein